MSNEYRVCAYWQQVNIGGFQEHRCVALNPLFTSYNWKVDDISCFNQDSSNPEYGKCNGEGTCWTCTKYSPGGLGFGKFDPETGLYRLPFVYVVYNLRALLSRCCYWDSAKEIFFTINASTGEIIRPPNHCTKGSMAKKWHSPDHPEYDLPCNGCKESCPYYTGVEWEYCTDDKLKRGDFITAKQIQELRYYSDDWNEYDDPYVIFKSRFLDADIFAWDGKFISADDGEVREIAKPGTYNFPVLNKVEINLDDNSSETTQVTPTVASVGTRDVESAPDFPTLIKDLNDSLLLRPKFIFPEKDYIHRHWKPDGNKITVIGYFPVNTEVYVVNDAFVEIPSIVDKLELESKSGKLWSDEALSILNEEVEGLIDKTLWEDPDHIYSAVPKNSGLFYIYNVELKIGKSQNLIVFAKDINDQWVFTKIRVHDYFYHIFVMQTKWESNWWTDKDFNNTGRVSGRFCFMPSRFDFDVNFNPSIKIAKFFNHSSLRIHSFFSEYTRYYYYKVKVVVEDYLKSPVNKDSWKFIDNCGRILLKLDDIRLNRYYWWDVDFVKVETDDGKEVRFEVEYHPNNESFPPNYVILRPKANEVFKTFSKVKSSLFIKYHYFEERQGPVNLGRNEVLVFPSSSYVFTSDFSMSFDDSGFEVSNVDKGPLEFRVDVVDDTGRVIGVKTVKFVVQYHQVKCRDFEIYYGWAAEYKINLLHPDGFVAGKDRIDFKYIDMGTTVVGETPICGDHQAGLISGIGPMWFPYLACENSIKYFPHTRIPNWCFLPVEGSPEATPRGEEPEHDYQDHRLRCPDEYHAWITGKVWPLGLLGAACWHKYSYGFYKRDSDFWFAGRAATRGEVNIWMFREFGWALPKFGNVLREMSILNRCVDYIQFFNKDLFGFDFKWVPITESWTTFDDIFTEEMAHPLKFVQSVTIGDDEFVESFDIIRYKYDDLLFGRRSSYIQYPELIGGWSYFYQYKDSLYGNCVQWAYKDVWKPIKRKDNTRIHSVKLSYPDYTYDYMKDEVQLVADEGEYDLEFNPPVYDLDGNISSDAYFKLGNGPPRYIDLKTLQWKDESAKQGGNTVTPKYMHYTTEDGWDRSVDLWSENCSEGSKAEARYYELEDDFGDKTKIYYFKGIKLSVNGNRFPYDESDVNEYGSEFIFLSKPSHEVRTIEEDTWIGYSNSRLDSDSSLQDSFEWTKADASVDKQVIIDCGKAICLREVEIGFFKGKNVWKNSISYSYFPGCSVYASNDDSNYIKIMDIGKTQYSDSVRLAGLLKDSVKEQKDPVLDNFLTPYRYYKIIFKNWTESLACFILNFIKLKKMRLKKVVESVKVYENKFFASRAAAKNFNIHGTEHDPLLEPDSDGSTIYVSENKVRNVVGNSEYKTLSRLRSRAASIRSEDYAETYGSFADINLLETKQYDLFDLAKNKLGNVSIFIYNLPENYLENLRKLGMSFPSGYLVMTSGVPKLKDIQEIPKSGQLWNASGHKYTWEKSYIYTDCCSSNIISRCSWMWTCNDYNYKHLNHANDILEESISPLYLYEHLFEILEMEYGVV